MNKQVEEKLKELLGEDLTEALHIHCLKKVEFEKGKYTEALPIGWIPSYLEIAVKRANSHSLQEEYGRGRVGGGKDSKRLDFLDRCNKQLNDIYGNQYGWKLILNHNVNRLMSNDHEGSIDLNDSNAGEDKYKSCREAIDEAMSLSQTNIQANKGEV